MARSKLAVLVGRYEGFGLAGKLPTRNHNPGDLRHSPHSQHPGDPNAIGVIDTDEHGWDDLERQLERYAARGMTLEAAVYEFAPPTENNTAAYLAFVVYKLGVPPTTPLTTVLQIKEDEVA